MTLALGLVGCGGMGRRHILGMEKLRAAGKMGFELVAVCDMLPENARLAADSAEEKLGHRPVEFQHIKAMINRASLDAVIVTTTPETHLQIGLAALDASLHIMVEKPVTLTISEGRRLVTAAQTAGLKFAVAENYRRDPINRLGKALIDSGAIGQPFLMMQVSSGSGEFVIITPWRHLKHSGGIIMDMGVHYADILEYYLGPLQSVYGLNRIVDKQRTQRETGATYPATAEDLSVGVAQFASGAVANWVLNMAGRGESFHHRAIYGTGGSLVIPGDRSGRPLRLTHRQRGQDITLADHDLLELVPDFALDEVTAALFGAERLASYDLEWEEIDSCLLAIEQADFAAAITGDRPPEVTGEQGLRALAVVFGFLEAGCLGRAVRIEDILSGATAAYEAEIEEVR